MAINIFNTGVRQVTSDGTARTLRALMNTASAGKGDLASTNGLNYFIINPEATVRIAIDGGTPTAAIGLECVDLTQYRFEGTSVDNILIIGAAAVNIQCGVITG